MRRYEGFINR